MLRLTLGGSYRRSSGRRFSSPVQGSQCCSLAVQIPPPDILNDGQVANQICRGKSGISYRGRSRAIDVPGPNQVMVKVATCIESTGPGVTRRSLLEGFLSCYARGDISRKTLPGSTVPDSETYKSIPRNIVKG